MFKTGEDKQTKESFGTYMLTIAGETFSRSEIPQPLTADPHWTAPEKTAISYMVDS